jgi:cytochrome c oxidase cbb3-type subunit 3
VSAGGLRLQRWAGALAAIALLAGCRKDDDSRLLPPAGAAQQGVPVVTSAIRAGGAPKDSIALNPYQDDEHALAAGRELYGAMNCAGCHGSNGGGGMGPPFADSDWIYGSDPENIVQSILQGRPNGMPAFGALLPASEAWKIATYVKHLGKPGEGPGDSPAVGSAKGSSTAARGP